MADVGLQRPGPLPARPALAATEAAATARERFLSPARTAGLAFFALFALTLDRVRVYGDGVLYHYFERRLFGDDVPAQAYQFGSAFWTAPFYLGSKLVAARGELGVEHATVVGTTIAANAAGLAVLYLGWRILHELDLPRGPAALLLALFGTPLWWYVFFEPSYKQAADTLYTTAAFWFLLRTWKEPRRLELAAATGACFGLMVATRYVNVLMAVSALVALWPLRAWRTLSVIAAATVAATALLYLVPIVRGIPYSTPAGDLPWRNAAAVDGPASLGPGATVRLAAPAPTEPERVLSIPGSEGREFAPTAPVKMLFTTERGLFVWTPLTAFACVGFALLVRRDRRNRPFLLGVLAAAVALLAVHVFWGKFWAGGSYSARFLTALFPLYLLGTAELLRRWRWASTGVLTLCAVWSVWIGIVILNGYTGMEPKDGVGKILHTYVPSTDGRAPPESFGNFAHEIHVRIDDRWRLYWNLVS